MLSLFYFVSNWFQTFVINCLNNYSLIFNFVFITITVKNYTFYFNFIIVIILVIIFYFLSFINTIHYF